MTDIERRLFDMAFYWGATGTSFALAVVAAWGAPWWLPLAVCGWSAVMLGIAVRNLRKETGL